MDEPILQVKQLSVQFSAEGKMTTAVDDISFSIMPGKITAIVGESGSGKSVTSLSLMQLLPPKAKVSGEILFNINGKAVNILALDKKQQQSLRGKDIAMIFQEPMTSLNPVFTCGKQVMEALQLHKKMNAAEAKAETIALFEKVKLPDPPGMIDRFPHQLSGGQKQRVMIAMAMSCQPALLIADEPTTALDVTVQKKILSLLKELQEQTGMSILLITHDLGLVADIADKVIVMYKGKIVEQGETMDVLKKPKDVYTKALLACRPAIHAKGKRLPVISDFLKKDVEQKVEMIDTSLPVIDRTLPVLEVRNLEVSYAGKKNVFGKTSTSFKAVDDVSLTVYKGETIGLVGESGCGKTTLGRSILQLIKPTAGNILFNGVDIAALPAGEMKQVRKELQIVFQDPYGSLNPRLSIGDAIAEPMKVHGIYTGRKDQKDKVIELLEKVNLQADHFNRYPHQFSGGQRQRICIARALALEPSFLVFDESVSALDVSVQAQVLNLINDLKKEFQFSSIFISHDLGVVRYISDRIMVMQKGKIIEEGNARDIYDHPTDAYTQQLINAIPGKNLLIN